jgi:hypothetical protein
VRDALIAVALASVILLSFGFAALALLMNRRLTERYGLKDDDHKPGRRR